MALTVRMPGARWDHCGIEVRRQLRVTRIQIQIIEVTFQHALLQTIRHSHVRDAAVGAEHTPMTRQSIAALRCDGHARTE
jgi:hypothetical protein